MKVHYDLASLEVVLSMNQRRCQMCHTKRRQFDVFHCICLYNIDYIGQP